MLGRVSERVKPCRSPHPYSGSTRPLKRPTRRHRYSTTACSASQPRSARPRRGRSRALSAGEQDANDASAGAGPLRACLRPHSPLLPAYGSARGRASRRSPRRHSTHRPSVSSRSGRAPPRRRGPSAVWPARDPNRPGSQSAVATRCAGRPPHDAYAAARMATGWGAAAAHLALGVVTGVAGVKASRGLTFHAVRLCDGRLADYRILAPIEWNFHPRGPLAEAIEALARGEGTIAFWVADAPARSLCGVSHRGRARCTSYP